MERNDHATNREWKSSAFTTYFGTPERAAELYQALNQEEVRPEEIEFATLQGVMYMARKNDMAFLAKRKVLVIGEHQSTINQNMPLRSAIYYGRTMEKLIPARDIYKKKRIALPTPEFYVFYNGTEKHPPEKILNLSDAYLEKEDVPMLELKVKVININLSANHPILRQSPSMYEYSQFVQKIRDYLQLGLNRDDAIRCSMQECVEMGIMEDFIKEHGSEVRNMLFTEFNMEDALEVRGEECYEDGKEAGEVMKLIEQVWKKLQKEKAVDVIADELEEEKEVILKICKGIEKCGPDCEKVYEWLKEN